MVWVRALRIHQWLKNLLIFVPLLTAFSFLDLSKVATLTLAFIAFSLAASATYIGNDLWDLENDREHPRKRTRAFASARLSIVQGLAVAGVLLLLGLGLACAVSVDFLLMLCLYLVLTSAYTWMLKKYVLIRQRPRAKRAFVQRTAQHHLVGMLQLRQGERLGQQKGRQGRVFDLGAQALDGRRKNLRMVKGQHLPARQGRRGGCAFHRKPAQLLRIAALFGRQRFQRQ